MVGRLCSRGWGRHVGVGAAQRVSAPAGRIVSLIVYTWHTRGWAGRFWSALVVALLSRCHHSGCPRVVVRVVQIGLDVGLEKWVK